VAHADTEDTVDDAPEPLIDEGPVLMRPSERLPPGATPPVPAVFLRFSVPFAQLDAALAECERRAAAHERRRRLWLRTLPLVLVGAALLWPLIDLAAGLGQLGFTRFAPLLVAAALLVPWALAPASGEPAGPAAVLWRGLGPAGIVLSVLAACVGLGALFSDAFVWWLVAALLLAARLIFSVTSALLSRRRILHVVSTDLHRLWTRYWGAPTWQSALGEARALVHALEPLTTRTAQATGWLDLSGPVRPWKKMPHAAYGVHSADLGARRYDDHWLFLEVALRGGARLRLRAIERVRVDTRLPSFEPEAEARWAEHMTQRRSTVVVRLDDATPATEAPPLRLARLRALGLERVCRRGPRLLAQWPAPERALRPAALMPALRGLLAELEPPAPSSRPWD
jgi:hypothetical protein